MVFNSAVKLDKHVLAVHLVLPDGAFVKKEIPNRRTQETSLHKQQQQAGPFLDRPRLNNHMSRFLYTQLRL